MASDPTIKAYNKLQNQLAQLDRLAVREAALATDDLTLLRRVDGPPRAARRGGF